MLLNILTFLKHGHFPKAGVQPDQPFWPPSSRPGLERVLLRAGTGAASPSQWVRGIRAGASPHNEGLPRLYQLNRWAAVKLCCSCLQPAPQALKPVDSSHIPSPHAIEEGSDRCPFQHKSKASLCWVGFWPPSPHPTASRDGGLWSPAPWGCQPGVRRRSSGCREAAVQWPLGQAWPAQDLSQPAPAISKGTGSATVLSPTKIWLYIPKTHIRTSKHTQHPFPNILTQKNPSARIEDELWGLSW